MDRSDVVYLVKEIQTQDENGVFHTTEKKRKVYANVQSVTMSEWFEGGRNGLNPIYRFVVYQPDYHEEEIVEYKGNKYSVYRFYQSKNDNIELYVQLKEGNNGEKEN